MASSLRYGVEVRSAQPTDAAEIARLLSTAGCIVAPLAVAASLDGMRAQTDAAALVATGYPGLSGLVTVSWGWRLQLPHPVARITALLVDPEERRRGIARLLLKAASQAARVAGCHAIEMDNADDAETARLFGQATGFEPAGSVSVRWLRKRG